MRGAHPERALHDAILRGGVVRAGERIVVACSGGPDSVALAAALASLAPALDLHLTLAYVNHGTRASAWQDECVVLRIGATFGLPVRAVSLAGDASDEASLRDARYAALVAIARDAGAGAIATAHHAEDQSETVLLALFRGTGPAGLAGMPARRPLAAGVDLIRPLLLQPAEELRSYCHAEALPYAIDPTNADAELRRNAVRQALTGLRPLFPGLDEAIARAAELTAHEDAASSRAGLRRQVRDAVEVDCGLKDVAFAHVEAAVLALERGGSGRFHMKDGVDLIIEAGRLRVETHE
ncbi:MAG TPA: tRNA lysidine(34) synthetase TilS [Candidatus Baltobacteraceae bacterium]